ncbi:MAG: exosortase/archaeosortase family protein [Planctomycetota bacterium]|nr:exosortase/archaeosortase family protein [Planctomycetota bacterium]
MRRAWTFSDGVMIAALVGLALVATWSVWQDIFALALRSDESSYILLAPGVALWLAWLRRERLRFCHPRATPAFVLVLLAGWGFMAIGQERSVDLARDFGALMIVLGSVFLIAGPSLLLRFAAAWSALLFVVPVPGRIRHLIAVPLQQVSAEATRAVLELFAVPIERHGNLLVINGAEVAIAEACNGMRMVAAMALIAFAFVFSFPMRVWARVLILALSPLVAILVNVIRLVPTTLLYGSASADTANTFHDLAGWAVLGVAIGVMWLFLALMRYLELPVTAYGVREEA